MHVGVVCKVPQAKCCLLGHSAFYQALFVHADYVSHICQVVCLHLAPHGIYLFLASHTRRHRNMLFIGHGVPMGIKNPCSSIV